MKRNRFYDYLIQRSRERRIPEGFARRHMRSAVWQALWIIATKEDVVDAVLCNLDREYQERLLFIKELETQKRFVEDGQRQIQVLRDWDNGGAGGLGPLAQCPTPQAARAGKARSRYGKSGSVG